MQCQQRGPCGDSGKSVVPAVCDRRSRGRWRFELYRRMERYGVSPPVCTAMSSWPSLKSSSMYRAFALGNQPVLPELFCCHCYRGQTGFSRTKDEDECSTSEVRSKDWTKEQA